MKIFKILIFCSLTTVVPFIGAMSGNKTNKKLTKTVINKKTNLELPKTVSPLDVVTHDDNIQNIIRAYLNEWNLFKTLTGHKWGIKALATTPDSKQIVSGANDNKINMWDCATGCLKNTLLQLETVDTINALTISPNGKHLLVSINNKCGNRVKIIDFRSGASVRDIYDNKANDIKITSDSKMIIILRKNAINIYQFEGRKVATINDDDFDSSAIAITPDDKNFIYGCLNGAIKICDLNSGNLLNTLEDAHSDSITSIAISSDGKKMVISSSDYTISIWDIKGNELYWVKSLNQSWRIKSAIITHDNKSYIALNYNGTIAIWDLESGDLLSQLAINRNVCMTLTPDGKNIISGITDNTIDIWQNLAIELKKRPIQNLTYTDKKNSKKNFQKCSNLVCLNKAIQQCAKCKLAYYCSQKCQKAHWNAHKANCKSKEI